MCSCRTMAGTLWIRARKLTGMWGRLVEWPLSQLRTGSTLGARGTARQDPEQAFGNLVVHGWDVSRADFGQSGGSGSSSANGRFFSMLPYRGLLDLSA